MILSASAVINMLDGADCEVFLTDKNTYVCKSQFDGLVAGTVTPVPAPVVTPTTASPTDTATTDDTATGDGSTAATGLTSPLGCAVLTAFGPLDPTTDLAGPAALCAPPTADPADPAAPAPIAGPGPGPAAPPPTPAQLAQQAIGQMTIPDPKIGIGPDFNKVSVNLWTWLWIDDPGPATITVTAGNVSVTAVAKLSSTVWAMGEPIGNPDSERFVLPEPSVCAGAGSAPPPQYDWKAEPPCGYMYHWRSLKERTQGTGTWPVTVTARWTVAWTATTGQTGTETLTASSTTAVDVAEYRIVLVQGPGG